MKRLFYIFSLLLCSIGITYSQDPFPVRGLCTSSPEAKSVETFIKFIDEVLSPRGINTLVLMVNYNYQFKSHPELSSSDGLTAEDAKKLVNVCRKNNIRLIPQVNLLGHQSWAEKTGKLLKIYPEFDETPHIKMPEKYQWPNPDGLYCKSYCPLHLGVHKIVFDLVDEICADFEADAFHAGMDEVFYIGHDSCSRCAGRNKAELFAGEVNRIRDHLALHDRQLWIWGDRLIDGKTSGIGMWEASMNDTWPAVDLISKEVVICDWHYEKPLPTPVYFAMKGFKVVSCPWRKPEVAIGQSRNMALFRETSTPEMKDRYLGMMQTVWYSTESFMEDYDNSKEKEENTEANCFKALLDELKSE